MKYTITKATYANADNTAALIITKEASAVLISQHDTPQEWAQLAGVQVGAFVAPKVQRTCTPLELMDRFTEVEQLAVIGAAKQNDALGLWYDRLKMASFVDLDDERVADGLTALVGGGLITAARKTEILK